MVKLGGFGTEEVQKLLRNKFVVVIGSSTQRGIYKDLIYLLNCDSLLSSKDLKAKGESTFCGDDLLEGGVKGKDGLHNGISYTEVRQYKTEAHHVKFYFITRCLNSSVVSIFEEFKQAPFPDVVIMNSCLWDLNRYGPSLEAMHEYRVKLRQLMALCKQTLPSDCLFFWNTTLPVASTAYGGVLVPEVRSRAAIIPYEICQANAHAIRIVKDHGYGVVDLHAVFQDHLWLQTKDGIHWCAYAHRHFTNILLKHVSDAWGLPSPPVEQITRENMDSLQNGLAASAAPAMYCKQSFASSQVGRSHIEPFDRQYRESFDRAYIDPFDRPHSEPSERSYSDHFDTSYNGPFERSYSDHFDTPYNGPSERSYSDHFKAPYNRPSGRSYSDNFDIPYNGPSERSYSDHRPYNGHTARSRNYHYHFDRSYNGPSGNVHTDLFVRPYSGPSERAYADLFDTPYNGPAHRPYSEHFDWGHTEDGWDQFGPEAPSWSAQRSFHQFHPIQPPSEQSFYHFGSRKPSTQLIRGRRQSELVDRVARRPSVRMVPKPSQCRQAQMRLHKSVQPCPPVRSSLNQSRQETPQSESYHKNSHQLCENDHDARKLNGNHNDIVSHCVCDTNIRHDEVEDIAPCDQNSLPDSHFDQKVSSTSGENDLLPSEQFSESDTLLSLSSLNTDSLSTSFDLPITVSIEPNETLSAFLDTDSPCHTFESQVNMSSESNESFSFLSSQNIETSCATFNSCIISSGSNESCLSSQDTVSPCASLDTHVVSSSELNESSLQCQEIDSSCASFDSSITISVESNEFCLTSWTR